MAISSTESRAAARETSDAQAAGRPANAAARGIEAAVVILLLVLHLVLANGGTWNKGATFDETAHTGNGYSFWATGDYRMAPDSILTQRWMTLPLYCADYKAPPTNDNTWYKADNWSYGRALLYELDNPHWTMLRSARFMTSLWNVGTALIAFFWARKLFGTAGGMTALLLFVLNPTALAHGSSVTGDAAATFWFTASIAALWHLFHYLSPASIALSCVVVGCAFVTKFTAVLLIPAGLLMAVLRIVGRKPWSYGLRQPQGTIVEWWKQSLVLAALVLGHVVAAWAVIWCLFGFRYDQMLDAVPGRDVLYTGDWEQVLKAASQPLPGDTDPRNGTALALIEAMRSSKLLPEGYLYVFASSLSTTAARSSFLNGRYGVFGFASFFPYCFLYKTPIAVLLLSAAAFSAFVGRRAREVLANDAGLFTRAVWQSFYCTAPLWIWSAVYWMISISRGINIGIRHVLPTFPAMFILVGVAGTWLRFAWLRSRSEAASADGEEAPEYVSPRLARVMQWIVVVGLVWMSGDVLVSYPNYLAYFNFIGGGTNGGHKYLVDSSLDWGQELPNLKRWLDENIRNLPQQPKIYVSYFGSTPPRAYGLDAAWLPGYFPIEALEPSRPPTPVEFSLQAGIYCVSATALQSVYNTFAPGPWRDDHEMRYQVLNNLMGFYLQNKDKPDQLETAIKNSGLPNWQFAIHMFDVVRFGRLCEYLRRRTPDATINGAFLVFNLKQTELQTALSNPPIEHYPPPKSVRDNVPY